ncbi:hypothetical protein DY000_02054828 [Brassica cretica]|uniref:Secreted protein n=1 Tax=Brassica cretica TaxID=69181 RepID=A0ABQ7A4S9_BRACR|nr:hypothetical protein DY000_02054828 [Brassica cretica]
MSRIGPAVRAGPWSIIIWFITLNSTTDQASELCSPHCPALGNMDPISASPETKTPADSQRQPWTNRLPHSAADSMS